MLNSVAASGGSSRLTRISYAANIPVDRAKNYLENLAKAGLVKRETLEDGTIFVVTPKGYQFAEAYSAVKTLIEL